MAVKDKIGGWQNNAYVYQSPLAYTSLKKLLGAEFPKYLNSFGLNDTNSIPPVCCFLGKSYAPKFSILKNIIISGNIYHQRL